jgi:quercetin dioxygenase-like cupin family protein
MSKNRFLSESHNMPWKETPFPGVTDKVLRIREDSTGVVELVRIAKGAALPAHRHLVTQSAFFLSGVAESLDGQIINAGSYAEVPPGERHGTKAIEEVVLLNMFNGAVTWFLDDGNVFLLKNDGNFAKLGKVQEFGTKHLEGLVLRGG